jgi:hypothetical protein
MARHVFTLDESRRGGRARARLPDFPAACSKGFWSTMDRHPFFARHHLKLLIRRRDEAHRPITLEV